MFRQHLGSHKQRPRRGTIEAIDAFDRELVKFVLCWAPYGPPPADVVLPKFGITSDRLAQCICDIAGAGLTRNLGADDRVLLLRTLALLDSASSQPLGSYVNPGHAKPSAA